MSPTAVPKANLRDRRSGFVPIGALLVGVRDLQEAAFIECLAWQLQTDGQSSIVDPGKTARRADSANPSQVRRNRETIGQILSSTLYPADLVRQSPTT